MQTVYVAVIFFLQLHSILSWLCMIMSLIKKKNKIQLKKKITTTCTTIYIDILDMFFTFEIHNYMQIYMKSSIDNII